ncbi:hypothetical protein LPJ55_004505 [Coemansia sp. RSA 990]|nr:hypothetical protein LPJ55_004505 [Coemansia sp. RSA 990]
MKYLGAVTLCVAWVCIAAENKGEIIVFGDDLGDTGNLQKATNSTIGYNEGRLTNGPTFVEYMATALERQLQSYAYANSTINEQTPSALNDFKIPTLEEQVIEFTEGKRDWIRRKSGVRNSIAVITAATTDLIKSHFWTLSEADRQISAQNMVEGVFSQVRALDKLRFEGIAVTNIPALYIMPRWRLLASVDVLRNFIALINRLFRQSLVDHERTLKDTKLWLLDTESFLLVTANNTFAKSIGAQNTTCSCIAEQGSCTDPADYIFYDDMHMDVRLNHLLGLAAANLVNGGDVQYNATYFRKLAKEYEIGVLYHTTATATQETYTATGAQFLSPGTVVAPMSATAGSTSMSRATDPLHDLGSPAALQYLFALNNSPLLNDPMSSPAVNAMAMAPKYTQPVAGPARTGHIQAPPALIVTSSPATTGALMAVPTTLAHGPGTSSKPVSPAMDNQPPGFFRPSEVFKTPEIRTLPDPQVEERTPELPMFDDVEALGTSTALNALSPRTQTAQAGLSLLAASATYARNSGALTPDMAISPQQQQQQQANSLGSQSPLASDTQVTAPYGAAFLNANGDDPTLMSQPHNSLVQNLSPSMDARHAPLSRALPATSGPLQAGLPANPASMQTLTAATGRLTRNRSLLRQSSGLSNASFYNDLVPQATESFFAPLDEVCSDNEQPQQQQRQQLQIPQAQVPPMGSQFSPIMSQSTATTTQRVGSASPMFLSAHSSLSPLMQPVAPHTAIPSPASTNHMPGSIFAQMPLISPSKESASMETKRRRTGTPHKRDQQRRFNCDLCDRSFARQYNLKTHRLTHFPNSDESRPYKCSSCTKAFTRRHDLHRHEALHNRKGKHICDRCGGGFPRKDSLRTHQKTECSQ